MYSHCTLLHYCVLSFFSMYCNILSHYRKFHFNISRYCTETEFWLNTIMVFSSKLHHLFKAFCSSELVFKAFSALWAVASFTSTRLHTTWAFPLEMESFPCSFRSVCNCLFSFFEWFLLSKQLQQQQKKSAGLVSFVRLQRHYSWNIFHWNNT